MFVPTTAVDLAPIMPGGCWDEASFHTVHENPYDESQAIACLAVRLRRQPHKRDNRIRDV